jgi:hypothetical protein
MSGSRKTFCAISGNASVATERPSTIPHAPGAAHISAAVVATISSVIVSACAISCGNVRIAWMLWQRDAMSEASRLWK